MAKTSYQMLGILSVSGRNRAQPPLTKKTLGDRAFENAAPKVWNRLPLEIRQCQSLNIFKVLLKTHLFKLAFY